MANVASGELSLRQQESLLILLNVGVLASLAAIHVVFGALFGTPVWLAVGLFSGRLVMQLFELAWVRGSWGELSPRTLRTYAQLAVWMNVAFACAASLASGVPQSHYIVLMVIPTVAAAFRSNWPGLAAVIGVAIGETFLYVAMYQSGSRQEAIDEYFEVATHTLTYLAVAAVVRLLAVQLRSEQRQLRDSLRELERTRDRLITEEKLGAVGRLAMAIAHEIRNPIGMITSACASVQRAEYEPGVRHEMCAIVTQESRRLERLSHDFLSFARQTGPQRQPTSLRTTLEYVAALVRPRAAERGQGVALECPCDQEVLADAAQLHQALLNLAANALEAAPDGATITLGAEAAADGAAVFWVAQPGPPLQPETCGRLFEPFFTTKPRGTGLGLAITRKIARAHGGDLRLTRNDAAEVRFSLTISAADTTPGNTPSGEA